MHVYIYSFLKMFPEHYARFMLGHVGWSQDRVDSVLLPVLKKASSGEVCFLAHTVERRGAWQHREYSPSL